MKELDNFKKFLNEGKLFEALNKDLKQFGPDLEKKLKDLGLVPSLLSSDKRQMAFDEIKKDPKKVAIIIPSFSPLTNLELIWNSASEKTVMKAINYFQTQTGTVSSKVLKKGWDQNPKLTKNLNPGDIFKTKAETYTGAQDIRAITYYRVPPNQSESLGEAEGELHEEQTNEIFGMGKKNRSKKGEMALDFSAFVEELFDEGVISKELHSKLSSGVAELYSNVMDAESGEVQKTYDYEPFEDGELYENDAALDEIINGDLDEGKEEE